MNNTNFNFVIQDKYTSERMNDLQRQFLAALRYKTASSQRFLADQLKQQACKDFTLFALMEVLPDQVQKPIYSYIDYIDDIASSKDFSRIALDPAHFQSLYQACFNEIASWQSWIHCPEEYQSMDFEQVLDIVREYRLILDTALDSILTMNLDQTGRPLA